jgi:hypothetical protein
VPRAWTLALGVMTGRTLPDEIPAAYRARFDGSTLRDLSGPATDEVGEMRIRQAVEERVTRLKELLGLD